MFSTNASLPGGRGQSLTDDAPPFPVFERHVMDVHGSATLPYAAHMNLVACACTDFISAFTSPTLERESVPF